MANKRVALHDPTLPQMIRDRQPFTAHGKSLVGVAYGERGCWDLAGMLIEDERERWYADSDQIRYAVFSHGTPIAWWANKSGWHVVTFRPRGGHQSLLRMIGRFSEGDRVIDVRYGTAATVLACDDLVRGLDGFGIAVAYDDEPDSVTATGTDYFVRLTDAEADR